jgi:endonuclease/exonuclease/phosphatase family metal-dependent hydrolase
MRSALSKLEARQQAVGCSPATSNVIICGDFNSGRGESVWRLLHR